MKRLLFLIFCSIMMVDTQSQTASTYTNTEVENSAFYQAGNIYQKDFLLFVDLLRTTHPAFASMHPASPDLDKTAREGYDLLKNCNNYSVFSQYLTSITSQLGDGHTYVTPDVNKNGLLYLFQLQILYPDVNLIMIPNEFSAHLKKNITKINEKPVFDVINSFRSCISSDNDSYFYKQVSGFMQFFSLWENNPYFTKDSTLTLTLSDGNEITITPQLRPQNMNELAMVKRTGEKTNPVTQPQRKLFFYSILEKENICYFQFNQCSDNGTARWQDYMSGKHTADSILDKNLSSIPRFDTMVAQMFDEIKNKNIKTLVVDVRYNGGGNSILCEILLSYLKSSINLEKSYTRLSPFFEQCYPTLAIDAKKGLAERNIPLTMGKIYPSPELSSIEENIEYKQLMNEYFHYNNDADRIFTGDVIFIQGKGTYSSAGLLITDAIDNGIGKVVGEKSAYKPCSYGDVLLWSLPNTKISGGVSCKIFNRSDETKCNEAYITPDVLIEETLETMLSGEDRCWKWIIDNYSE